MPCTISGVSIKVDSAGAVVAWTEQKYVYLQPSRTDFLFNRAASGTWLIWEGDPDLVSTYPGAIRAAVNLSTGAWSFSVPFSDTEVQFVGAVGPAIPPLKWNIIDPNVSSGVVYYYGETLAATVSTSKTLRELLNLGTPWQMSGTVYTLYPSGTERRGSVTFAAGESSKAITWADIGTATWSFSYGLRTDDSGITGVKVVSGTETATGCTVELTAAPAATKTARVDMRVTP